MEVDVLYVGAGPATMASALRLMQEVEARGLEPPTILVIEKSAEIGDHLLSGAVMNPRAIRELLPDFSEQGFPTEYVCDNDMTYLFFPKAKLRLPINPPFFKKKGYHVVSLSNVVKWMSERCEAAGDDASVTSRRCPLPPPARAAYQSSSRPDAAFISRRRRRPSPFFGSRRFGCD